MDDDRLSPELSQALMDEFGFPHTMMSKEEFDEHKATLITRLQRGYEKLAEQMLEDDVVAECRRARRDRARILRLDNDQQSDPPCAT